MRRFAIIPGLIFIFTLVLAGCGHHSTGNTVIQVTLNPTSLSLNSGDVVLVTASANNSAGTAVPNVSVTFGTSNSALVTVSPAGLVCAGVWDTEFIVCNSDDTNGNPVAGSATVTASAQGVTSAAVPVTVHIKVTSVVVDPISGCTSTTLTQQLTAHACSTLGIPLDSTGPCAPNAKEITSQILPFSWSTVNPTVAAVDQNGLVTAASPGVTGVFAAVSTLSSAPVNFRTCMPIEIRLHLPGDLPGSLTTSDSLTQNATVTVETDMTDEKGFSQNSISTMISSDYPVVGTLASLTFTAISFGGAGISAGCTPPVCGSGLTTPVYSNLFQVTVPGASPAPMVYATSSFAPPPGVISTLLPIDTSKTPPAVGTAVMLPGGTPNSMVFAANGATAYIGTDNGLVSFTPAGNIATLVDKSISGKVLAVSPDGATVIASNAATDPQGNVIQTIGPSQRLWIFNASSNTTQTFVKTGATAASIGSDQFRDYIVTNDGTGNIYVFSPDLTIQTINIPGSTANDVASLPSGPFAFVANPDGLDVVGTCNNVQQPKANNPPVNSNTIQLLKAVPDSDTIVAVDSSGVDVETVKVTSILSGNPALPFTLTPANCQPNVSYSNEFMNFGIGSFTARQLLVATNGGQVVVLPSGNSNVLVAVPGTGTAVVPLAGGATEPLSGGMLPDGSFVWVGVNGTNTVDEINLTSFKDVLQVPTSFKKSDGTPAPPDIVAVQPK